MQALLRQLPCSSVPRALSSASASTSYSNTTSGAAAVPQRPRQCCNPQHQHQLPQQRHSRRSHSHIVRITGKREEYDIEGLPEPEDVWGEDGDQEFIEIDTMPMWAPEKGPYESRIFREPDDEKETKAISIEDTAYWFADSQGIDTPRTKWMRSAPVEEATIADEQLFLEDVDGCPPRLKWTELEEGDELVGIVTDLWLWHGAFVDVLADCKGLIPVRQPQWPDVEHMLMPGTQVLVKVHKIMEYPKYRFPIQLELLEPSEAVPYITRPEDYQPKANVGWCYDQGWDIKTVAKELGREYEDTIAIWEPDHADWTDDLQYEFGYDAGDGNPYPGDWITREVLDDPGMSDVIQEAAVSDAQILASTGRDEGGWGI